MKASLPRQLFVYCAVICIALSSFQIGVNYGATPYRVLGAFTENRLKFAEIGLRQSNTLSRTSCVAFGFSAVGFVSLLWGLRRRKEAVHPGTPVPGRRA